MLRLPASAALLSLLFLAALGACAPPPPGETGVGPGPEPKDGGPLLPAFYSAQHPDLVPEPYIHNGTPQPVVHLADFGLVVSNESLDPDELRAVAPEATFLAYMDIRWVGTYGPDDSLRNYQRSLFSDSDFWLDDNGNRRQVWPETWELLYNDRNAQVLADFAVQSFGGFDGIYLDDFHTVLPEIVLDALEVDAAARDSVRQAFATYRDTLTERIASRYGGVLVANVGYMGDTNILAHLPLDGICAEEWWVYDRANFLQHVAAGYDPRLCVAWEWDPQPESARRGYIRYRPWFDGAP